MLVIDSTTEIGQINFHLSTLFFLYSNKRLKVSKCTLSLGTLVFIDEKK